MASSKKNSSKAKLEYSITKTFYKTGAPGKPGEARRRADADKKRVSKGKKTWRMGG